MTIDEHIAALKVALPCAETNTDSVMDEYWKLVRGVLAEVARDQRVICANVMASTAVNAADEIQIVRNTFTGSRYESLTKAERQLRDLSNVVMNAEIK